MSFELCGGFSSISAATPRNSHKYHISCPRSVEVSRVRYRDDDYTTTVPRRGRHSNTAAAFSSENFLARAGLACVPGITIISRSRPSEARTRTRVCFITPDNTFTRGRLATVRAAGPTLTSPRRPWLVRFPRATVAAFFYSRRPSPFPTRHPSIRRRRLDLRTHILDVFISLYFWFPHYIMI